VELAEAKESAYDLLNGFASNVSADTTVPHSYANGRVVRDLAARLGLPAERHGWRDASVERINSAAAELLREESAKLRRAEPE
jgi:hypothetical protein